jgi:AcrR family transcriptional regulator
MEVSNPQTAEVKPNRMERRRLETRAKLLSATLSEMSDKGIDGTTLDDITEAADLSRRTFYYHFPSKEACLVAAAASAYEKHSSSVKEMFSESEDPAFVVARATQLVMSGLLAEPITRVLAARPKLLAQALTDSISQYVTADIRAGIRAKRFNPVVRGHALTTMMMWTLVGLIVESIDCEVSNDGDLRQYAVMCLVILGLEPVEATRVLDRLAV